MIYSPHTFELTLNVDYGKFSKLLESAYEHAKSKHKVFKDENDENIHYDEALKNHGIRIRYIWSSYKKRVQLIINPSKVLGGDDIPKLWKPNKSNITKLLSKLESLISDYFDSAYDLNDFTLTRMDFTVNIDVGSRKKVSDYIKVLHNLGRVKGYSVMKDVDWINKDLAYVLRGNSNDINFWAYDKEGRERMLDEPKSRIKSAKGILRIEIQISTNKALLNHTDESVTIKQIKHLSKSSKAIFMGIFTKIVPDGDFYKKDKVVKMIGEAVLLTKKEKEKMVKLVELIPVKKSLLLAQKGLKSKDIKGVMKLFESINLNPVTISKRHRVKGMGSLYGWLN